MRFRTKTILGVAVIELSLLLVLVSSALTILRDSNEAELTQRIQLGAKLLAAASKDAVISQDLATLDSLAEEAMNTSQIDVIRILDFNGVILTERGNTQLLSRKFHPDKSIDAVSDGIFDWSSPVVSGKIHYGEIQIGVSIEPLNGLLQSARRWAAGIAGLEILLVAIFSWLLGSYLVRQLGELRIASRNFAAGNFNHRVAIKGNDELAYTARAFNLMAQQIGESHALLQTENMERLKAQQRAERAQSQAEDRNEQLNGIFSLSPDGFVSFDSDCRVKYANPAFTKLTGLTKHVITGLDKGNFSALLSRQCSSDMPFPGINTLQAQEHVNEQNGALRQKFKIAGSPHRILEVGLREAQTQSISQILYFRDITHETEVERMKSEFLSTAAHELRTPMACIYGYTELMLAQEFDAGEQREFLATIFKQSELMMSIVNELLDLASIESRRKMDFKIESINVSQLVHEACFNLTTSGGSLLPTEVNISEQVWVHADHAKIIQVLGNILSNAYKYSPSGGTVCIGIADQENPGQDPPLVGIRITDHGIGMTEAQLARVFERFYRADTSGKIPGTGLGMSIVKEIVELHGGHVEIKSEFGKGTEVTVWLPFHRHEKIIDTNMSAS